MASQPAEWYTHSEGGGVGWLATTRTSDDFKKNFCTLLCVYVHMYVEKLAIIMENNVFTVCAFFASNPLTARAISNTHIAHVLVGYN